MAFAESRPDIAQRRWLSYESRWCLFNVVTCLSVCDFGRQGRIPGGPAQSMM